MPDFGDFRNLKRPLALLAAVSVSLAAVSVASLAAGQDAGTAFFRVAIEDQPGGDGIGSFSASTGPSHPAGDALPVLFAGDDANPNGSYLTVRSYTTGTDYVQTATGPASGNLITQLDPFASVEPIGDSGYRATYDVTGAAPLRITSEVAAAGSTFEEAAITLKVTVTNTDIVPLKIGVRYLLDFELPADDGPAFALNSGALTSSETTFAPLFASWRVENAAAFRTFGSASGATPDRLQYAYAPDAFAAAFDYSTQPRDIASPGGLNDSAVLVYFGATEAAAITLAPGEFVSLSLTLSSTAPPAGATPPPFPIELPRTGKQ